MENRIINTDIRDACNEDQAVKQHFNTRSPENWSFEQMIFTDCVFDGLEFYNCKFINAKFENCQFKHITFNQCDLTKAHFNNCRIEENDQSNLVFRDSKLNGCEFNECHFQSMIAKNSSWIGVSILMTSFKNSAFYDCTFARRAKGAYFNGLNASKSKLQNMMMNGNNLSGLHFEDCDLTSTDFSECSFIDTLFRDCQLNDVSLRHSTLHGLTLERVQLFEVDFDKCASITGLKISKDLSEQMLSTFGVSIV